MKSTIKALIIAATLSVACADATEPQQAETRTHTIGEAVRVSPAQPVQFDIDAAVDLSQFEVVEAALPTQLPADCDQVPARANLQIAQIMAARQTALANVSNDADRHCVGGTAQIHMMEVEETSFYKSEANGCGQEAEQEVYVAQARAVVTCLPTMRMAQGTAPEFAASLPETVSQNSKGIERPVPSLGLPVVESCQPNSPGCCADEGCCLNAGGGESYCQGRGQELPDLAGPETRF